MLQKLNLPKSVVPGTKLLRDPLSAAYVLEKNFKIMDSYLRGAEGPEFSQYYQDVSNIIRQARVIFTAQVEDETTFNISDAEKERQEVCLQYLNGVNKYMRTCTIEETDKVDATLDGWQMFRKFLAFVVSKHKNIDI